MATGIQVAGLVTVKIDSGDGIETLGYQADMTPITFRGFWHDVPGDLHGGPQGPPIDIQHLGDIAIIRCELSKYDEAMADDVIGRLAGSTAGTIASARIGRLAFQDSEAIRVILDSTNDINFPICIVREAIEINLGTKYSTFVCEFEAHRNQTTGILYNTSVV